MSYMCFTFTRITTVEIGFSLGVFFRYRSFHLVIYLVRENKKQPKMKTAGWRATMSIRFSKVNYQVSLDCSFANFHLNFNFKTGQNAFDPCLILKSNLDHFRID